MKLKKININCDEDLLLESENIRTIPNKKYAFSIEYKGIKGKSSCAYFGVFIVDENNRVIDRRIKWLNDFSGKTKQISLIMFSRTDQIRLVYGINYETMARSNCEFELKEIKEIKIEGANLGDQINHDEDPFELPPIDALSEKEEKILEQNLVWVFSSTRSGNTWLGTKLLTYETFRVNEPILSKHLGLLMSTVKEGKTTFEGHKYRHDYFFSLRYRQTWKLYLKKLILHRIYAQTGTLNSKIIIWEPGGRGHTLIEECLPNSKIIFLFRDGRDVIASDLDANINLPPGGRFSEILKSPIPEKRRGPFIENHAHHWVDLMNDLLKIYENHNHQLSIKIKYEDLRKNTLETLKKIYEFIDVDISISKIHEIVRKYSFENIPNELKGEGMNLRKASPGQWKDEFYNEEIELMNSLMGPTLNRLGYDV